MRPIRRGDTPLEKAADEVLHAMADACARAEGFDSYGDSDWSIAEWYEVREKVIQFAREYGAAARLAAEHSRFGWWKVVDRSGETAYYEFHPSGDGRWRVPRGTVWLAADALGVEGEWSEVTKPELLGFLNLGRD